MTIGITEYSAGFDYNATERGISVSRVYHYDPDNSKNGPDLPVPGSVFVKPDNFSETVDYLLFPTDMSKLICRSVNIKPLAGHPSKREYIFNYTNEPVDKSIFTKEGEEVVPTPVTDLPMTIEYAGEFITVSPTDISGWKWDSDGAVVVQPMPNKVNQMTLRISRYVPDTKFDIFSGNVKKLAGRVNLNDDPFGKLLGGKEGSWLFTGAPTEIIYNWQNVKWWKADLEFTYRNPTHSSDDSLGWQKVMRLNGKWDIPYNENNSNPPDYTLYFTGDFTALFDDSVIAT